MVSPPGSQDSAPDSRVRLIPRVLPTIPHSEHIVALVGQLASSTHINHHPRGWLLAAAGLIAGCAVGLTGMGGGALMTPMLVLIFKIDPKIAIASDLVNSLIMKPIGGGVHIRRGTIHWRLVAYLTAGSLPAAFVGAYAVNQFGDSKVVQNDIKVVLGWALVVACASLIAKSVLTARAASRRAVGEPTADEAHRIKPLPTLMVGVGGGFLVGMTSVGSGSMMIVLLMLLYPRMSSKSLVGTDLVQAVPLVASAALGQAIFGHVDLGLASALLIGSIPGVYVGARLSSRAPDGVVRPILILVLGASALGLLLANHSGGLGIAIAIMILVGVPLWGAVDATLRPIGDWRSVSRNRTTWVSLLGIGAPFGIGFVMAVVYFGTVRRSLAREAVKRGTQSSAFSRSAEH